MRASDRSGDHRDHRRRVRHRDGDRHRDLRGHRRGADRILGDLLVHLRRVPLQAAVHRDGDRHRDLGADRVEFRGRDATLGRVECRARDGIRQGRDVLPLRGSVHRAAAEWDDLTATSDRAAAEWVDPTATCDRAAAEPVGDPQGVAFCPPVRHLSEASAVAARRTWARAMAWDVHWR